MVDNNISPSKVSKHPDPTKTTGNEVKDRYYYFEKEGPAGEFIGKWDGKKFILPGEENFLQRSINAYYSIKFRRIKTKRKR